MKYSRSLVATLLMSGGLLQLAPAALADGTAAGTIIDNTANATYEDSNAPITSTPTIINATSNTVKVTVAQVAGIIVTGNGITANPTGTATITAGNELYYNFKITNTGNVKTQIHIPSVVSISSTGTLNTTGNPTGMQYSVDGTNWIDIPAGGVTPTGDVAVNGNLFVRVAITVNSNAGTTLDVRLGDGANNSTNEDYLPGTSSADVYTIAAAGTAPVNLQRESSAIQSGTIGATTTNAAFATVLMTRNTTVAGQSSTPATLNDDIITYNLSLKVEGSAPATATGITAADLAGTDVITNVGGTSGTTKRILISSAVPAGTTLENTVTTIAGWTKVYTTDAITGAGSKRANEATWTDTYSATATRVGFVSAIGATVTKGTTIPTGLTFSVKSTATGTAYTVNSIAQAFGSTSAGADLIYDESGDQTPSNYDPTKPLVTSTFSTVTGLGTTYTTGADGVAVGTYEVDSSNNNTGTASPNGRGEINKYSYTYTAAGLLNGPKDVPEAEGLTSAGVGDNNLDFTNQSAAVPANLVAGTLAAPRQIGAAIPVGFINTVHNKGTAAANIQLLPEGFVNDGLPNGTTVRIYDGLTTQSATYTISGVSATSVGTFALTTGTPVTLANVPANGKYNYSVEVTLPGTTGLSTDTLKGYPVAINAFTGTATAPTATNKTINRVYNGFIKMTKETKIIRSTGPAVAGTQGTFSEGAKTPGLGNIIEYRITYTNISEAQAGSGNVVLGARNLTITEDGTGTIGTNSWAKDFDLNNSIDTSHVIGSAAASRGSVNYFTGATGASSLTAEPTTTSTSVTSDVTKYVNTVTGTVAPTNTGTFTFQRKLN